MKRITLYSVAFMFAFVAALFSFGAVSDANAATAARFTEVTISQDSTQGKLNFVLNSVESTGYTVSIVNDAGKQVYTDNITVAKGKKFNVPNLAPSSYQITLTAKGAGGNEVKVAKDINIPLLAKNSAAKAKTQFTDLTGKAINASRKSAIVWMYQYGITTGMANNPKLYAPQNAVNRGAMAQFLHRLAGSTPNKNPLPNVSDISKLDKDRQADIKWLASEKVTVLQKGNTYKPGNTVNRGAMAEFLWKIAGSPAQKVTAADKAKVKDLDKVKNNPDRQSAIAWLVKNNISVLQKGDVYNPSGTVNRGAMAEFMQKLYQKVMIPDVGTIAADKTVTNPNTGTANKVLNKGYSYKVALSVVTFNSNAGSAVDKQIVETGKKVIKPKDPTKAGYEFDGWFQDAAFKTAFDFAKTTVTKDITLYAAWTKLWTVTFDPGEGTCESDCAPQLVRDGALATEPLIAPNRLDYDFKGWQILGAEKFPFDTTPIYNDITLHAIWEAKQLTLVETTYAYDETTLTETSVTYKFNIPVLEPASIPGQDYKVTLNAAGDEATVEFVPDYDVLVGPNEIPVIGFAAANNDKSFTTEVTVLYKVDGEGVRKATAGTGEVKLSEITDGFQVEFADADRPFAWVATEPSVKKWVHLGDTYILNIVRAIFLPNIDVIEYDADTPDLIVARALDLFHVKLVDDLLVDPVTNLPNTPDTIVVSGEKIPNVAIGNDTLAEVHVGAPGEFTIVDNSELPDFIIPPGKLGTSSVKYEHSRLVINAGAYIDVQSSQYFGSTPNLNEGLYHNGNVRVTNGAFLRESGYSDWPLGADSTYTVQIGGKMAVGPGNREGAYMQKTSKDNGKTFEYGTPTTNTEDCGADGYCHGFIGWLLGTEDDSLSSIQIGHIDRQSGAVDVAYGWVYITNYTYVKVAKYANIYPYNVLVGGGSTVEIAAKLDTEQGGIQAKFYGAVGTSISQGTVPATFPGSTITLTGEKASVSPIALGFNAGDDIKSGTFYAITPSSPVPATQSPWAGTTEYQNGWKEVE